MLLEGRGWETGSDDKRGDTGKEWGMCWGRVEVDLPVSKLKKPMSKKEARYVPGRKREPRRVSVFMAVPSCLAACERYFCCFAIWRLSLDSLMAAMLYS